MALLFKETAPLWGIWKIEESSDQLLSYLDREEWYRSFLQQHRQEGRRQEWLAVRVLLKTLLGREVRIGYLEHGAPYLPGERLHISVSHTRGYAAVLLSEAPLPGIDIEYISERVKKISTRFMSESELGQLNPASETIHMLLHWSGKETLFKALQEQEVDFRRDLHIRPFLHSVAGTFQAYETRTCERREYVLNYRVTDDFVVTFIT